MTCRIVSRGPIHLIGVQVVCEFDQFPVEIPKARMALIARRGEITNLVDPHVHLGVHKEKPTSEAEDGYFIGYEVTTLESVPDGMIGLRIPEQAYAICEYQGPPEGCHAGYDMLEGWIVESGLRRIPTAWTVEVKPLAGSTIEEIHANFQMVIHQPLQGSVTQ